MASIKKEFALQSIREVAANWKKGCAVGEEPSLPALKISVLGGLRILTQGGETVPLSGRKDRALIGFLAISPGITFSREKLATLLWSESGERQARDSLKQALLRLRRCLYPVAANLLITDRQTVTLSHDRIWVDARDFEALLQDRSVESIERAAELYAGDLLDGISVQDAGFEDWLQVERERLRGLANEALAELMTRSLSDGRRDRACSAARRLLALDPLQEAACRTLMQLQAERGERTQALKLFETLRCRLQQELGVTPEPETLSLYRSIRNRRANGSAGAESADRDVREGKALAGAGPSQATAPARREPRSRPSIAVLPFANIGEDPKQDYFADGLTEEIITDLSQVSGLFVASRHSAFVFKGKAVDAQKAAQELQVGHILQGCVRTAEGRVRITAQLLDGSTGEHLWAERYDRSLKDIFALQDEIAKSIVGVLKVKLLPEELACITSQSTSSVDAYQYYLIGRSFYLRGIDRHGLNIARKMFGKAVEIDPGYARAYAALAACESYLSMSDPAVTYDSSLANSLKALALDPNLAEAHAARGLVLYADGRFAEATLEFELALGLGPDLHETHFLFARNCRLQGLHEQAASLFEQAAKLRPDDYRALGLLASEYKILDRPEAFKATARRSLERAEAAIEAHPDNADALAFGSALLAELGQEPRAEAWAERAVMIGAEDSLVHYNVARTYAFLGKTDVALDWLERAFRSAPERQRRLAQWMTRDDDLEPLRGHSRFRVLADRLRAELEPRSRAAEVARQPTLPRPLRARRAAR